MSRLLQDLRFAARSFAKAPAFTAVAILVLALGIGANSATFTIVNALIFEPVPTQQEGMVGLFRYDRTKPDSYRAFSYPNYLDIREKNDVFDSLAAHTFSMAGVPAGETSRRIFVELVTANYFDTLRVRLAAGRPFLPEEERPGANLPVVIASYDKWAATGFDSTFLGSTLTINSIPHTVVGVAPRGFTGTMALVSPEAWLPLGMFDVIVNDMFKTSSGGLADPEAAAVTVLGRLKPDVTIELASERLEVLSGQMRVENPLDRDQALTVARLPRMSNSTSPRTDAGLGIVGAGLMGITATVLLIACLNLANMLLARGTMRKKEIAIRLALGGGRGRIARQLLTESLLLAFLGAAAGLVLASWSTSFLVASLARVMPLSLVFESKPDLNVLLATAGFVGIATLISGLGPAFKLSRLDLVSDLKEQASEAAGGTRAFFSLRNGLVVAQLALSLGLLSMGGLFARSALSAASSDPGFSYDRAILAAIDTSVAQMDEVRSREVYRAALERVRALPGIEAASVASTVPFGNIHEGRSVERPGIPSDAEPAGATYRIVGADYFRSLGLSMVRGREFTIAEEQAAAPRVAIIDAALAARLFPGEDPIGQTLKLVGRASEPTMDLEPMVVVGLAPPIREELMDREVEPHLYVPAGRNYRAGLNLHVRTSSGDEAAMATALGAVREALRSVDSRLPILEMTTFKRFHDNSLELWALNTGGRMFLLFGLLALGLAVAGVYGVKSYLVARRTREIGIRMALGARHGDVVRMVMRESAVLTLAGLACGLPIALGLGQLLASAIYDVRPFDPLVFTAAPLSLAAAALVASYIPARRATRVDPLSALRTE